MKFFVTDAQLAALRLDIYEELVRQFTITLAAERDRYGAEIRRNGAASDSEIQRLREDRREELTRLTDPQGPLVQHYEREVTFWRRQFLAERQRTDIAVDQCRVTHQNIGPVTLPPREDRLPREFPATDEQALASLNIDGL
jgi:hypothetical protein